MLTVRRIYLYLVSAISLTAVAWAVIGLIRLILTEGVGQGQISQLAMLLAVIIVGLPIFLFHWLMAQRLAAASPEERNSPVRQLYFYGVLAAGAAPIISNIYRLVDNGLLALLGGERLSSYPYDLTVGEHLAAILVWSVIWFYFWRLARPLTDRRQTDPQTINLAIRRLYLLALSLAGLVMVTWGGVSLLRLLLQAVEGVAWQTPVAHGAAQLLVGGAVWLAHWRPLQQDFASGYPAEERSVLRKIYLYLAIFAFSVMALGSGALLLRRFLERALGAPPSGESLLTQLSFPLPLLLVGVLFWAYHWVVLRQDAFQAPEAPRQAGVRRIYAYLVAGVGLFVLLGGVGGLLTQLVELLTSPFEGGVLANREQIALFVAMTVVGGPVWWLPWRAMQKLALTPPDSDTPSGLDSAAERRSTVRKIYLYLFVFVASLVIFGSAGWFVFQILSALLGAELPADFLNLVLDGLVISGLAGVVWLYHWLAIRRDGELAEEDQAQRLADIRVVVLAEETSDLGQAIERRLATELPGVQVELVGLAPSPAALTPADYVVGAWSALISPPIASALAETPALALAIPVPDSVWTWVGLEPRSPEAYARQTVAGIKQAIEGEALTFDQGPEWGTVAAVGLGVVIFLCIGGSLINLGLGLL